MKVMHRVSTLVEAFDVLRCPVCGRRGNTPLERVTEALPTCPRCGQHWWTMRLDAGAVHSQLVAAFGEPLAAIIAETWPLPERVAVPKYWRLLLSKQQYEDTVTKDRTSLVETIVRVFHQRSVLSCG